MDDTASATEELLAQAAWARRLARRLVADEARADDVLQQAWLAALQQQSDAIRSSARGWLGGVLRHVAAKQRREAARREARERVAAAPELDAAQPAAADHVAELEAQRLIVDALLRVEEPYRETLVRRWYRDEKPAAIARAMGIPVKTADTRLARGLERLRAELTALRGGVARDGMLALLPLAASAPVRWVVLGSLAGGGLAVGAIFKFAAALVVAAAGVWWAARDGGGATIERAHVGGAGVADAAEVDTAPAGGTASRSREADPEAAETAASEAATLVVHVTDDEGRAVDSTLVNLFREDAVLGRQYLVDGVARLPRPEGDARLLVESRSERSNGFGPFCVDVPAGAKEWNVTLPRGAVLSGRLVCDGAPPGCDVGLTFKPVEPFRALRGIPEALRTQVGAFTQWARAVSDGEGRFRFAGLDPDVAGWLCVDHEFSTMPIRRSAVAYHLVDSVKLERPAEGITVEIYAPPAIVGRLVDRTGAPRRFVQLAANFDDGTSSRIGGSARHGAGGRFRVHVPAASMRRAVLQFLDDNWNDAALLHVDGPFHGTRDVGDVVLAPSRTLRFRITAAGLTPEASGDVLFTGPRGARRSTSWSGRDVELVVPSLFTRATFTARGFLPGGVELPAEGGGAPLDVALGRATRLDVHVVAPVPVATSPGTPGHLFVEIGARGRLLEAALDDPELASKCVGGSVDLDTEDDPGWTFVSFSGPEASLTGVVAGASLRVVVRSVTSRALAERTVVLEPGEVRALEISLDAELRKFSARVVDEAGAPLANASVGVRSLRRSVRYGGISTSTDEEGRASFEEYFDDDVAVEVEADGYVPQFRAPVRIARDTETLWRLERFWPLAVEVVDVDGQPVDPDEVDAVASADLGSPEPARYWSARAESGGRDLLALPATPLRVRARVAGRDYFADVAPPAERVRVVVPAHGSVALRWDLPLADHAARGELLGAVELAPTDARGAALSVNTILYSPQRPTGGVTFSPVLPGRYEAVLLWRDEYGAELRREPTGIEFEVTANETSEVKVER